MTSAQLRTRVRPPRVPNPQCQLCRVTLKEGERGRGQSPSVSKLGCLPAQLNSARSALVVKATSPWTEPGCLDRPHTQVTSLDTLIPKPHSPEGAQPGPPGGPWGKFHMRPQPPGSLPSFLSQGGLTTRGFAAGKSDLSPSWRCPYNPTSVSLLPRG